MTKPKHTHAARKNPAPALTPQQLIAIDRERRARTCAAEIGVLLKKHNCQIQARATIIGDKVQTATAVIALDVPEPRAPLQ